MVWLGGEGVCMVWVGGEGVCMVWVGAEVDAWCGWALRVYAWFGWALRVDAWCGWALRVDAWCGWVVRVRTIKVLTSLFMLETCCKLSIAMHACLPAPIVVLRIVCMRVMDLYTSLPSSNFVICVTPTATTSSTSTQISPANMTHQA